MSLIRAALDNGFSVHHYSDMKILERKTIFGTTTMNLHTDQSIGIESDESGEELYEFFQSIEEFLAWMKDQI